MEETSGETTDDKLQATCHDAEVVSGQAEHMVQIAGRIGGGTEMQSADSKNKSLTAPVREKEMTVRFFAGQAAGKFIYLASQDTFAILKDSGIVSVGGLPSTAVYKTSPLTDGRNAYLFCLDSVYIIDPFTEKIKKKLPLPPDSIIGDNYFPVIQEQTVLLPLQNTGYYTLQLTEEACIIKQLYYEPFPFSPVIYENKILIGSYYNNYLAAIDVQGRLLWQYTFEGQSFANPVVAGEKDGERKVFFYNDDKSHHLLIQINSLQGNREKAWELPVPVYADFIWFPPCILGINNMGHLFSLNTETAELKDLAVVVNRKLSISEWRRIHPLVLGQELYLGTDQGRLLIYDMQRQKIKEEIMVDKNAAFYAPPIAFRKAVYLISNEGFVYRVTNLP
jgi:hypothetical protein